MGLNREQIDAAFFERLKRTMNGLSVEFWSRRELHWSSVKSQPAVLFFGEGEVPTGTNMAMPPIWKLHRSVVLYMRVSPDREVPASMTLNPYLDAVEKATEFLQGVDTPVAFGGPMPYYSTLGGLVAEVRIGGEIARGESLQELGQLLAAIPIEITVPALNRSTR